MKTIDHQTYLALREGAEVLEIDHCGEKVLRLVDGSFLKLFRRKRLLSSALWYPYAQRFADNSRALRSLGIEAPKVLDVFRIPTLARDAVHYQPVAGQTLRALIAGGLAPEIESELKALYAKFLDSLSDKGVYFRSLHLGNVVLTPDHHLALIDVADMSISGRPLGRIMRARQLRIMARIPGEADWNPRSRGG